MATLKERAGTAEAEFRRLTPRSGAFFEDAQEVLVAGTVTATRWSAPYPIRIDRAEGAYLYDVDGRRYVDFSNSHSINILGHSHPKVLQAIRDQLEKGLFFGSAPASTDTEVARILVERCASISKVVFSNSGTEATMGALRLARVSMKRDRIAKIDGGYHGWHDTVLFNSGISTATTSGTYRPGGKLRGAGVPSVLESEIVLLPFNDIEGCERAIREHKDELAAVIVEPFMGGATIPPEGTFLNDLADLTKKSGILLVFDEMITFGLARGGAQEYYGATPDLTCMGKVIGGGMPIGAFGGREDLMALLDPRKGRPAMFASGTFSGHPLAMAAGAAQLKEMTPALFAELHRKGDDFRARLRSMFARIAAPLSVSGVGQFFCLHALANEPRDWAAYSTSDFALRHAIATGLKNRGFWLGDGRGALTAATEESHVVAFIQGLEESIGEASLAANGRS